MVTVTVYHAQRVAHNGNTEPLNTSETIYKLKWTTIRTQLKLAKSRSLMMISNQKLKMNHLAGPINMIWCRINDKDRYKNNNWRQFVMKKDIVYYDTGILWCDKLTWSLCFGITEVLMRIKQFLNDNVLTDQRGFYYHAIGSSQLLVFVRGSCRRTQERCCFEFAAGYICTLSGKYMLMVESYYSPSYCTRWCNVISRPRRSNRWLGCRLSPELNKWALAGM